MNAPLPSPFAENCFAFLKCPPLVGGSMISAANPKWKQA